jgi:hypothetical protein
MAHPIVAPLRRVLIVASLALAGTGAATLPAGAQLLDRVLAVVNGQIITLSDVRGALAFGLADAAGAPGAEAAALDHLIARELMLSEVNRFATREPDAAAANRRLQAIRSRFKSEAEYAEAAARTGMDAERLLAFVNDDLRLAAYIDQRFSAAAQPTDDEIARYFREHRAEFDVAGVAPPLDAARSTVSARLVESRRQALVDEWLLRLRQRAEIVRLAPPGR